MKKIYSALSLLLLVVSASVFASPDYWIDVRTAEEFSEGHLEGAVNIPFDEIVEKIDSVASDKNAEIYLYCRSGRRASKAKLALEEAGFTHVRNIGGLEDAQKEAEQ